MGNIDIIRVSLALHYNTSRFSSKIYFKEKQMKKILLTLTFAILSASTAFAHEAGDTGAHHHDGLRHFTSPEINVMEYENNFSGYFHGSYINMSPNKKQDGYEGYVIFNGNKINAERKKIRFLLFLNTGTESTW